jgi:hypothetical protein
MNLMEQGGVSGFGSEGRGTAPLRFARLSLNRAGFERCGCKLPEKYANSIQAIL